MRDVSGDLVPSSDAPVSEREQLGFLDAIAAVAAATWGWVDTFGLVPMSTRWGFFGTSMVERERALGFPERVPELAALGWDRFEERVPAGIGDLVRRAPSRSLAARRRRRRDADRVPARRLEVLQSRRGAPTAGRSCSTGRIPASGRSATSSCGTSPSTGPGCPKAGRRNRRRTPSGPHSRPMACRPDGWWERQLGLSLLGGLVQFGWEKALGDDDELNWWCRAAAAGAAHL